MKKHKLIGEGYPFIDHYTIYSYKPKNQKGPAREEQTFILSYLALDLTHFNCIVVYSYT